MKKQLACPQNDTPHPEFDRETRILRGYHLTPQGDALRQGAVTTDITGSPPPPLQSDLTASSTETQSIALG